MYSNFIPFDYRLFALPLSYMYRVLVARYETHTMHTCTVTLRISDVRSALFIYCSSQGRFLAKMQPGTRFLNGG